MGNTTMAISRKISILMLCMGLSLFSEAQQLVEDMLNKYPDKNLCNLLIKRHFDVSISQDKLVVIESVYEESMYLSDHMTSAKKETVTYSSFYDLQEISAETLVPNGKKFKSIKIKEFNTNTNSSDMSFHDDSKERSFYFTHLKKGAITKLDYKLNISQPNLISPFYFADFNPSEKIELSISFPDQVEIGYKTFNMPDNLFSLVKTKKGSVNTYTWTRNNIKAIDYESDAVNPKYYLPQIHLYLVKSTTSKGVTNHVGSIDNLHGWYRELIKEYEAQSDDLKNEELKKIVDSLVNGLTDEKKKVQTIFNWVQNNINYIAFEYEFAGFIPRPANLVCSRRFGDCKDMASIIKAMLKLANIESYLTWIGTRSIPYNYTELATPSVDNHMITTYFDSDKKPYFLDATDKYIPFGAVSQHIQEKEALVSISQSEYKLIKIPASERAFSIYSDTSWIKIDNDKLIGTGKFMKSGHYKNYCLYDLASLDESELFRYFKFSLQKGSNKFKLIDYKIHNQNEADLPLIVNYNYEIDGYVKSFEGEIYVDMNLLKKIGTQIKPEREIAFDMLFAHEHREVYVLEIPTGYQVDYVPKDYHSKINGFEYSIEYKQDGNKLIYTISLVTDILIMDKAYFKDWNATFVGLNKLFSETVLLKKSK